MELTTDQKGAIAEAAVAHAAIALGVGVARPLAPERYDLIFDLGARLVRVQCKWAVLRGAVVAIRCCSSRRAREGIRKRAYSPVEVDAYAAFCDDTGDCYFLPLARFAHQREITLRLDKTRNNQQQRIRWARDFRFEATLGPDGAIAQLGERVHGMHEVAGSSPAGSTF
jgi:hypothetical protein